MYRMEGQLLTLSVALLRHGPARPISHGNSQTGWQICFYSCRSDRFWLFCLSIFKIFITGGRNVAWYQTKTHSRFVDFKYFKRSVYASLLMCTHTINIKDWFTNYRQRRKIMIYCRWNAWKESVVHQSSQREANNSGDFYLPKMRRAMRKFCPEGKRRAQINVPFNIWWKKFRQHFLLNLSPIAF